MRNRLVFYEGQKKTCCQIQEKHKNRGKRNGMNSTESVCVEIRQSNKELGFVFLWKDVIFLFNSGLFIVLSISISWNELFYNLFLRFKSIAVPQFICIGTALFCFQNTAPKMNETSAFEYRFVFFSSRRCALRFLASTGLHRKVNKKFMSSRVVIEQVLTEPVDFSINIWLGSMSNVLFSPSACCVRTTAPENYSATPCRTSFGVSASIFGLWSFIWPLFEQVSLAVAGSDVGTRPQSTSTHFFGSFFFFVHGVAYHERQSPVFPLRWPFFSSRQAI